MAMQLWAKIKTVNSEILVYHEAKRSERMLVYERKWNGDEHKVKTSLLGKFETYEDALYYAVERTEQLERMQRDFCEWNCNRTEVR